MTIVTTGGGPYAARTSFSAWYKEVLGRVSAKVGAAIDANLDSDVTTTYPNSRLHWGGRDEGIGINATIDMRADKDREGLLFRIEEAIDEEFGWSTDVQGRYTLLPVFNYNEESNNALVTEVGVMRVDLFSNWKPGTNTTEIKHSRLRLNIKVENIF
jgi:type II secretory pathway component PulJ